MDIDKKLNSLKKNIMLIFLIAILALFIGLIISFFLMIQIPAYYPIIIWPPYPPPPLPPIEEPEPLFIRFITYLISFFTGNWGESWYNASVIEEMFTICIPRMIELMIIPLILAIPLGILLGRALVRGKHKWVRIVSRIIMIAGLSLPIFLLGIFLHIGLFDILSTVGADWQNPPLITGFPLIDALFSGDWGMALSISLYYIIPMLTLTIAITALVSRETRSRLLGNRKTESLISNSLRTGVMISFIFMYYLLVSIVFNLSGLGTYLLYSLLYGDIYILNGAMYVLLIMFVIVTFISNLIFVLRRRRRPIDLILASTSPDDTEMQTQKFFSKEDNMELKSWLNRKVKSPVTIIGIIIVCFFIFIALFPFIFTPYSVEQLTPPYFSFSVPYSPPSPDHPLGTAYYGYDLLGLIIHGIGSALGFGILATLIGILGGLGFGYLASKFNRGDKVLILGIMTFFFIFPSIVIVIIMSFISEENNTVILFITGILLIPLFTKKIANTKPTFGNICRELIIYIPHSIYLAILMIASVGFLRFNDRKTVNLGEIINRAFGGMSPDRFMYNWTIWWTGLALFILLMGFVLLHEGLRNNKKLR